MGFREMSTSLHTCLGAESYLADWEILQIAGEQRGLSEITKNSSTSNIKRDGQHYKPA
jgi:hypothetical protein